MTTVVDINVLLPILVADHVFHGRAWQWWEQQADGSVGLCLLSRLGILRMLTNRKVMGGHPVAPGRAHSAWDLLSADPRSIWLEPGDHHEATFRRLTTDREGSMNLWTDAWLAALAASGGHRLTSFDSDFYAFDLPEFEHLYS